MKLVISIVLLITLQVTSYSQTNFLWNSKKNKIKIPFEFIQNLIIIDVNFNGIPLKMILDTGSDDTILFDLPQDTLLSNLDEKDKISIKGVGNGNVVSGYRLKNNLLSVNEYADSNFDVLFLPDQDISIINKLGLPINGIIGSRFFESYLVEIDYEHKLVILHREELKANDSRLKRFNTLQVSLIKKKPYVKIPITLNDESQIFNVLFDSGLGDGLWLFENDTLKCNTDFFNDFLGVGLSGEINGKRSRIDKIDFSGFALKKALVSYPDTTAFNQILVNNGRNGSIGGDVLKRFNWFLDYKNEKFYFKKNNLFSLPFEYNMSGIEIQHAGLQLINQIVRVQPPKRTANQNEIIFDDDLKFTQKFELKPIFSIHAIRKDSPAEKAGLQVGDKILKINNKQAHQLTMQWIMDLFQSKDGKWISILVERNGEQIKYKFQLKKIL